MKAVQPFIDTSISKTVNVPEDYPYEEFEHLYRDAWSARLKGLATYRPNTVLGSVLSVPAVPQEAAPTPSAEDDPLRKQFDSRPLGPLESVTSKVEYFTQEGKKTVYLTVSFIEVDGVLDGQPLRVERPFEFFMPAGQKSEGQQWITASMRLLSMVARSGGSIARALADMREVVWDKGPVRCGHLIRSDGAKVPLHHDSEVAAIGFMLQSLLTQRGFLDETGTQVSVARLAELHGQRLRLQLPDRLSTPAPLAALSPGVGGKKCPECGAYALRKVDGCSHCAECHYVGECG